MIARIVNFERGGALKGTPSLLWPVVHVLVDTTRMPKAEMEPAITASSQPGYTTTTRES